MSVNNFQVNILDVLGLQFNEYLSKVKALSLTNPTKYSEIRIKVSTIIINNAMHDLYLTLFHALTSGNLKDGTSSLVVGSYGNGSSLIPSYPSQMASEYSISICRGMEIELRKIVELLFPSSYNNVANQVLAIGTKGQIATGGSSITTPVAPNPPTTSL